MTIQSAILLRKLRRVQIREDGELFVDFGNLTASTANDKMQKVKSVKLKAFQNSIHSILQYLEENGYIQRTGYECFQVLHKGWHPFQEFLFASCQTDTW